MASNEQLEEIKLLLRQDHLRVFAVVEGQEAWETLGLMIRSSLFQKGEGPADTVVLNKHVSLAAPKVPHPDKNNLST